MVRRNLAQKTYDVFIMDDGRWLIDSHHDMRSLAMDRAEELLDEKRVEGVKVISESERTGEEEVLLEEVIELGEKPLKIVPVEEAPVCEDIADLYKFPARLSAGRLLRQYLDRKGITGLELAFDYGLLRMLEREEKFFPVAISRIGQIQAKKAGTKPAERNDKLYTFFEQIKENARTTADDPSRLNILENGGLTALIGNAPLPDDGPKRIFVMGALALALQKRGDWSDKIELVIELAKDASDDMVTTYLDGIAAEVLDSSLAVRDFFGGFGDPASAYRDFIRLSQGRCQVKNPRSCIADFNNLMANRPMPQTIRVLTGRVARSLGGVRPLTREGKDAEHEAVRNLIREMIMPAGLVGGARMAGAITGRVQITFAEDEDISVEDAISQILALLPNRAVRLGFLLDIIGSDVGQKNEQAVLNVMARLVQQLTSLSSLVPSSLTQEQVDEVMDGLREKLASDALPEKWRALFSDTLDRMAKRGKETSEDDGTALIFKMEEDTVTKAPKIERREAKTGDIIFEEGDAADEAYLITSGKVEVYRKSGNGELVLATLGKGDVLGEMSLIDNQPRMASARIVGDAKLTVITQEDLSSRLSKLSDNDKVLRRLMDVLVDRIRGQARLHE